VTLFLVRHGATDWTEAGRFNGMTDVPLNEAGRAQARQLKTELAGMSFVSVLSSDLVRALETAELAAGTAAVDGRLRELDFGELEGKTWDECSPETQESLLAFDTFVAPGGESVGALAQRVRELVGDLGSGDHLLFTHGGVIRLLLRAAGRDERVHPGQLVQLES
jgi:probable phosphoglycerate mutase